MVRLKSHQSSPWNPDRQNLKLHCSIRGLRVGESEGLIIGPNSSRSLDACRPGSKIRDSRRKRANAKTRSAKAIGFRPIRTWSPSPGKTENGENWGFCLELSTNCAMCRLHKRFVEKEIRRVQLHSKSNFGGNQTHGKTEDRPLRLRHRPRALARGMTRSEGTLLLLLYVRVFGWLHSPEPILLAPCRDGSEVLKRSAQITHWGFIDGSSEALLHGVDTPTSVISLAGSNLVTLNAPIYFTFQMNLSEGTHFERL
jgi:hypothetical protein